MSMSATLNFGVSNAVVPEYLTRHCVSPCPLAWFNLLLRFLTIDWLCILCMFSWRNDKVPVISLINLCHF